MCDWYCLCTASLARRICTIVSIRLIFSNYSYYKCLYYFRFDTLVPLNTKRVHSTGSIVVNFSDKSNIREKIIQTLRRVLNHILNTCEDDTKSLCLLIRVRNFSIFQFFNLLNKFIFRFIITF